jgi:hypothetical protein
MEVIVTKFEILNRNLRSLTQQNHEYRNQDNES